MVSGITNKNLYIKNFSKVIEKKIFKHFIPVKDYLVLFVNYNNLGYMTISNIFH